jgi:hypothetical protein
VGGYQKNPESLENRRPSPRISPVQTSRRWALVGKELIASRKLI